MRALILAAGAGTRLGLDGPKCMAPLAGRPLLHWQLDVLRAAGIDPIAVVVGHRADKITAPDIHTIANPRHHDTNMVESLFCAHDWLTGHDDDTLVTYGDLLYDTTLITAARDAPAAPITTVVGRDWLRLWSARSADPLNDAETLQLRGTDILDIGRPATSLDEIDAQYVGITRLSPEGLRHITAARQRRIETRTWDERIHMTDFLRATLHDGQRVTAAVVNAGWLEVDTASDLALYEDIARGSKLRGWIAWPPMPSPPRSV
jgi:L-glutamine-phosphate cytidylyltransferase